MISRFLDDTIGVFSPGWAARRMLNRARIRQISNHASMNEMIGDNGTGGYDAGKQNRLMRRMPLQNENTIPSRQMLNLRIRSWNLFRNNPQARKVCRSLQSKVIGTGLAPRSQALLIDGTPHKEFRKRARELWSEATRYFDYRGRPGFGGQHVTSIQKTALLNVILSGSVLWRLRHLRSDEWKRRGSAIPLLIQLIHRERLDDSRNDDNVFRGIAFNDDDTRSGYYVLDRHPSDERGKGDSRFVSAEEMGHLFVEDDVDQHDGAPWLAAAITKMGQRADYEYNELVASAAASCFVAGYRRASGQSGGPGLQMSDTDRPLSDGDGNPITHLAPGMLLDLGFNGELQLLNPTRPSANIAEFIRHQIRSEAAAVPGVKSSTLTMDHSNSSFSSERSADNDAWPELEGVQAWFNECFNQPIYERVIETGVRVGWFDDVESFSTRDFINRRQNYLKANWQGPVARSINPKDDARASADRVKNGQSSPQREAALIGCDAYEVLQEIRDYMEEAAALGVPEDLVLQRLGIQQQDTGQSETDDASRNGNGQSTRALFG